MLVATDLDGTLVPSGGAHLGRYTAEVLERADGAGVPVVFVTARPLRWMPPFWPHVGRHGLAILSNGAITYDVHRGEVIATTGIEPALGLEVVARIAAAVPDATFAIECVDGIRLDPDFVEADRVPSGSPRGPLAEVWDVPAVKLLVRHPALADDAVRDRVIAAVGGAATATWSVPGLIEISAPGISKASALVALCARLGVAASEVIAFGDMPNDLPMLDWAGTSYAVANAHETVLACADHVAPSCDDEGVAQVVEALLARSDGAT